MGDNAGALRYWRQVERAITEAALRSDFTTRYGEGECMTASHKGHRLISYTLLLMSSPRIMELTLLYCAITRETKVYSA